MATLHVLSVNISSLFKIQLQIQVVLLAKSYITDCQNIT